MNRRHFLTMLAATAGAIVLPEPRRVYSFPSAGWLQRQSRVLPGVTVTCTTPEGYGFEYRLPPLDLERLRAELQARVFDAVSRSRGDLTPGGIEHVKRVVALTLERFQIDINRAALRNVVIRGKVSV